MKNTHLIGASAFFLALIGSSAMTPITIADADTVAIERVDIAVVATGFRSSKLVGASVTNDARDTIGKVDDVIVSSDGKTPFVIVSVGGFLGVGSRLVAVPFASLRIGQSGVMLPGGTKNQLEALPEFKYAAS
jgi:hypothetical protein